MSCVILVPLLPLFVVGISYRSTVLFGEYFTQPMDMLLMPLITVSTFLAACCLLFSFGDFVIVKFSHALFSRCAINKRTTDQFFLLVLSFTGSIKIVAYLLSAFCLGNIGCWVMLGIILKPAKAIPLIVAAVALFWHVVKYAKTLDKLYKSMNKSLSGAIDAVASNLRERAAEKLNSKLSDIVSGHLADTHLRKLAMMASLLGRSFLNAPIIRVFPNIDSIVIDGEPVSDIWQNVDDYMINLHVSYMLGKWFMRKPKAIKINKLVTTFPKLYRGSNDTLEHNQNVALTFYSQHLSEFSYIYEIVCNGQEDIFNEMQTLSMQSPKGWEEPYVYLLQLKQRLSMADNATANIDTAKMELLVHSRVHISTLNQLTGLQYPWAAICEMIDNAPSVVDSQSLHRNIGVTGYVHLSTAHAAYMVYRAALNSIAMHPTCRCGLKARIGPDIRKKDPESGEYVWYSTDGAEPIKAQNGGDEYYRCPLKDEESGSEQKKCNFFVYKKDWHKTEAALKDTDQITQNLHNFFQDNCPGKDIHILVNAANTLQAYLKQSISATASSKASKFVARYIPGLFTPCKLLSGQKRLADGCFHALKAMILNEKERIKSKETRFDDLLIPLPHQNVIAFLYRNRCFDHSVVHQHRSIFQKLKIALPYLFMIYR